MVHVPSAGRTRVPEFDGGLGRAALIETPADRRCVDGDANGGRRVTVGSASVALVDINARLTPVRRPR